MSESEAFIDPPSRWFRFSIRGLLLLFALIAVFLGGRASMRPQWQPPEPGPWVLKAASPNGRPLQVQLARRGRNRYALHGNTNLVFVGEYVWKNGQLIADKPRDKRFKGLAWKWSGDSLLLVDEPLNHPSGGVYVGTRMWPGELEPPEPPPIPPSDPAPETP
jgi:hypothetical protein